MNECTKILPQFRFFSIGRVTNIPDSRTVVVRTMATASLRMDSPNTNMLRMGSTSRAWKMASVATGSTAEMREPNAKLWTKFSL